MLMATVKVMFGICFRRANMFFLYNCNKEQYLKLLDYLFPKCDVLVFALPNYECDTNDVANRNNMKFLEYKKNVSPFIEKVSSKIIYSYHSSNYFDQHYNYEREIFVLKFDEEIFKILKRAKEFKKWRYPNRPEDLCFFSNNKLLFSSISHEDEYRYFDNSDETSEFIEQLDIVYRYYDEEEFYYLNLSE